MHTELGYGYAVTVYLYYIIIVPLVAHYLKRDIFRAHDPLGNYRTK